MLKGFIIFIQKNTQGVRLLLPPPHNLILWTANSYQTCFGTTCCQGA